MDNKGALERLEDLRDLIEAYLPHMYESSEQVRALARQIWAKYGEVEDVVEQFAGRQSIAVLNQGAIEPSVYPNFIEAGFLSGRAAHAHEGYTQLTKIIGKVRVLAEDPALPISQPSVSSLVRILGRLRECCQYIKQPPSNEKEVQDIVWIILRSNFDRVEREETLPKLGLKNYRPDFGIPELATLVEVKFIGEKTNPTAIQEEILADVPGYLTSQNRYLGLIALIYDSAQKLRDPRPFIEGLRQVEGILDVLVTPGIAPGAI